MDVKSGRLYISHHAIFDENTFPFRQTSSVALSTTHPDSSAIFGTIHQWLPSKLTNPSVCPVPSSSHSRPCPVPAAVSNPCPALTNPVQTGPSNPVQSLPSPIDTQSSPVEAAVSNPCPALPNLAQSSPSNPVQSLPSPIDTQPSPVQALPNSRNSPCPHPAHLCPLSLPHRLLHQFLLATIPCKHGPNLASSRKKLG